jgi:hypothetical protein
MTHQSRTSARQPADPRVVGGRYRSGYWQLEYTVNGITVDDRGWLTSITVTDKNGTRTHGTYWDQRDQIIYDPRTETPVS